MSAPNSFSVAALTALIGAVAAAVLTTAYADWHQLPKGDIGAGFVMLGIALASGIGAFTIGWVMAGVVGPGFWKALACSSGVVLAIAGVVAFATYQRPDLPPTIGGDQLMLHLEIRLPVGHTRPAGEPHFKLATSAERTRFVAMDGDLKLPETRLENERWVIPADVRLFTARGPLTASATVDGKDIGSFVVPLPAVPSKAEEEWSAWLPQPGPGEQPQSDAQSSFRFRVRRVPRPTR